MAIKNVIQKITSHSLARDSATMFAGSMTANIFSYLYHLLMGRLLGPIGYGELSSLLSIFYIFSIPLSVGQLVLVKFISVFKANGEIGQSKTLFLKVTKISVIGCIVLLPIIIIISPWITDYLQIRQPIMFILVYGIFVFSLLTVIMASVLQGYQKFLWVSILGAGAILIKICFSVPAVPFGVVGVLIAVLLSAILAYACNFIPLGFLFRVPALTMNITKKEAFSFAIPTLLVTLGMTSLYSTDMILVRHYFQPLEAGIYASLAVMGKIVFYGTSVVTLVFYPVLSERYAKGERTRSMIRIGLGAVTVISSGITLLYFLFPKLIISLLFGTSYLAGAPYLGIFGVFLVFYTIGNMFTTTFLATGKTKMWCIPVVAALLQILGIILFHNTLLTVIYIDIAISILLVLGLGVYYVRDRKERP